MSAPATGPGAPSSYPIIIERRPPQPRACLGCGRVFRTTIAQRLCPRCRAGAE